MARATTFTLPLVLLIMTSFCQAMTVVDMTYVLGNDTIFWPGNPAFKFRILARGNSSGGYWYEGNEFSTPEHGGTHVDAPAHFGEGKWRVDDIPVGNLVGPAAVIDVVSKAKSNPDYLVSVEDITSWEAANGRLPNRAIVIMNSGWGTRYPDPLLVFNTQNASDPSTFHFPGIHPDTATFLTSQRDVIAVGVDTPSTDFGQSTTYETHVILGSHNIIGLENLANVARLPSSGATVVIGLVKLQDGSGGPARIVGIVGNVGNTVGDNNGGGAERLSGAYVWMFALLFAVYFSWREY